MHRPHSLWFVIGELPVIQSCDRGPCCPNQSNSHGHIGTARKLLIATGKFIQIKYRSRGPCTQRHIRNYRMQRMTEPGSMQEVSNLLHETVFLIERRFGHSVERFLHRTKPLELVNNLVDLFHVNDSHIVAVTVRLTNPSVRSGSIV
ncbi:MAG: hypothetical protein DMF03_07635 [Verrucomicrobia bacterium]|nr:MAG: hypothetical protein DMF03_07635 [Verrucomicrobiota bacterium]